MTLHIISDNPLLLFGITEKMHEELPYSAHSQIKIHYPGFPDKEINSNDMVLICIYDKVIRMNELIKIAKISRHIALMVDCVFEKEMGSKFPLRVSRRSSFKEIIKLRDKIRRQSFPVKVCDHTYRIFRELYSGSTVHCIVERNSLNITTMYSLKQRVFRRFGLENINDKGIFHCMEYLEINRLASNLQKKDAV